MTHSAPENTANLTPTKKAKPRGDSTAEAQEKAQVIYAVPVAECIGKPAMERRKSERSCFVRESRQQIHEQREYQPQPRHSNSKPTLEGPYRGQMNSKEITRIVRVEHIDEIGRRGQQEAKSTLYTSVILCPGMRVSSWFPSTDKRLRKGTTPRACRRPLFSPNASKVSTVYSPSIGRLEALAYSQTELGKECQ